MQESVLLKKGDVVVILPPTKDDYDKIPTGRIGRIRQTLNITGYIMVRFGFEDFVWVRPQAVRPATDKEALQWRLTK